MNQSVKKSDHRKLKLPIGLRLFSAILVFRCHQE